VDVHPPHRPIASWKDFLLHLVTITVGLCIALGLEAMVEAAHHRHIVRDARANLRREIEQNHARFARNAVYLRENRERLENDIRQLLVLRHGGRLQNAELKWNWAWDGFEDAAWKSARDIGALPYMDAESLGDYATIYAQQEFVNGSALAIIGNVPRASAPILVTPDPAELRPADVETMLSGTAELEMRVVTLEHNMRQLDEQYATMLAPH